MITINIDKCHLFINKQYFSCINTIYLYIDGIRKQIGNKMNKKIIALNEATITYTQSIINNINNCKNKTANQNKRIELCERNIKRYKETIALNKRASMTIS